ncbi:histone-lysine N-methyltransferase SETDB1-A-like isoform X5 [Cyclopterus lumpus]|uniref:histone-lysine N-methyltransferase SETDB1-A-like isoform X5 n=1 Tax=Cyclopterus lumpus TaxID=8103 RepID=UPI0014874279|nr:histone-lysine N-methyltransferase SETDB1-A-like isoform X5 [Cyclopterus lumpus]
MVLNVVEFMEGDEIEMSPEELQVWFGEKVKTNKLMSSDVLEKFNLLQSLLERREKQAGHLLRLYKSVSKCEVVVKKQYSSLGWEYRGTDSDDDNITGCGNTVPNSPTPNGLTSLLPKRHDSENIHGIKGKNNSISRKGEPVVVLTRLSAYEIRMLCHRMPENHDNEEESSINSDMQWQPQEDSSGSEFSVSNKMTVPNKRRRINPKKKTRAQSNATPLASTNTGAKRSTTSTSTPRASTNTGAKRSATSTSTPRASTNTGAKRSATSTSTPRASTNTGAKRNATSTPRASTNTGAKRNATSTSTPLASTNTGAKCNATSTSTPLASTNTGAKSNATSTSTPLASTNTGAKSNATSTSTPLASTNTGAKSNATSTSTPLASANTGAKRNATSTPLASTNTGAKRSATSTSTPLASTNTGAKSNATSTSTPQAGVNTVNIITSLSQNSAKATKTPPCVRQVELKANMTVLARRKAMSWIQGEILEQVTKEDGKFKYKIRFEKKGKSLVSGHHIAFDCMPKVDQLFVGARVVVKFSTDQCEFFPGVLGELPSRKNRMRFLVFIDDHKSVYVGLPLLRLVCRPLNDPLDDIPDGFHKNFLMGYMKAWPYPPQTQFKAGQIINVELGGVVQSCVVRFIDCSLIQVVTLTDEHKEWIYRGSTCLEQMNTMIEHVEMNKNKGQKNTSPS